MKPKLSTDQASRSSRFNSEPSRLGRYSLAEMPTDPSGRYRGDDYDPLYFQRKSKSKPRGTFTEPVSSRLFASAPASGSRSGTNSAPVAGDKYASQQSSPASAPKQYGANGRAAPVRDRDLGQASTNQARPDFRYDGRGGIRLVSPRSPSPTKSRGPTPTGPASLGNAPPPSKAGSSRWPSSASDRQSVASDDRESRWTPNAPTAPTDDSTPSIYKTAPESTPKKDGETSSSPAPAPAPGASSPTIKVHPSRLGLVPQGSSPLNPNATSTPSRPSAQTPSYTKFAETPVNARLNAVRPAALDLAVAKAANIAKGLATPSTADTEPRPSSVSYSPVNKSPLDSLEKLRRFKETVAASRKSANNAGSSKQIDMSKLAKMAGTYLQSQDEEESEAAFKQMEQMTGAIVDREPAKQDAVRAEPPAGPGQVQKKEAATPTKSVDTPRSAASRQAELKERLLALKHRDGTSQSPRESQKVPGGSQTQAPETPSQRIKRERQESGASMREEEQKRRRAEAWAQHQHLPATSDKRDERRPSFEEREEGETDRYERGRDSRRDLGRERTLSNHAPRPRQASGSTAYGAGPTLMHGHTLDLTWKEAYGYPGRVIYGQLDQERDGGRVPAPRAPSGEYGIRTPAAKTGYAPKPQASSDIPASGVDADAAYEARRQARARALEEQEAAARAARAGQIRPVMQREPVVYRDAEHHEDRHDRKPIPRHEAHDLYTRQPSGHHVPRPQEYIEPPPPPPPVLDTAVVLAAIDVLRNQFQNQLANLEKMLPGADAVRRAASPGPPVPVAGYVYPHDYGQQLPIRSRSPGIPRGFHSNSRTASPPPPPPRGYASPPPPPVEYPSRDLHSRISSPINARHERSGPYKVKGGGYKGRDGYHDQRTTFGGGSERGRGRGRGDHHSHAHAHARGRGHHAPENHGYGHGHGHAHDQHHDHGYGHERGGGGGSRGRGGHHRGGERGGRGRGRGRGGPPR